MTKLDCVRHTDKTPLWRYHVVALLTACVWSTTFVSTKVLILAGLSPENIFFYRFFIAYVLILFIARDRLFAKSAKDELLLFFAGLTGGSLYFFTENTALRFTYATNVSILISTTPLLTIALSALIYRQKLSKNMIGGSLLALAGVVLVVLNGDTSFHVAPVGDILTIIAALCWAVYSILMKVLIKRGYSTLFITRKVFFYGLLTIAPYIPFSSHGLDLHLLYRPEVYGNLLFLGVLASFVCFAVWNRVIKAIGPDKASNYIYFNPIGTIITAVIFLHEPLSVMAIIGAAITIIGVIIAEKSGSKQ